MAREGAGGPGAAGRPEGAGSAKGGTGPGDRAPPGRVVLVGFMGAGKSTVGPLLAARLGYRFVDLDAEVERVAGATIPALFRERGEAAFRRLEARATAALDEARRVVVAAGGGWMARPALRDRWPDAVRVWLRASPATILARVRDADPGDGLAGRPLLDPADPARSVRRLLEAREADYRRAELAVETDGRSPEAVARAVARALLERAARSEPFRTVPLTSQGAGRDPGSGAEPAREPGAPGSPGTAPTDERDGPMGNEGDW